ncbi:MAG TPA: NUDIX hydrolase [Deltaproteobacteria bacterium]|jgi:ADP-ribose pyrophosphatase|nr:NUDIX hydrolase [Deltaproteobacteria bacterium]
MEETIRTLGILKARHFSARLDSVRLRTGKVTERIKIDHPEAAAILAFADRDHLLMVRQWRYAIGGETLEIPAGKMDPGESAEVCAGRELTEETGQRASRLIEIFSYYPAIGYANEMIRIFMASGLERTSDRQDQDEISGVEFVKLDQVHDMIMSGRIRDGKTVIGVSIFRAKMERGEIPDNFFL